MKVCNAVAYAVEIRREIDVNMSCAPCFHTYSKRTTVHYSLLN